MKRYALGVIFMIMLATELHASDSIIDIYGLVTSVDITPVMSPGGEGGENGRTVGYRRSITVKGKTYPFAPKMTVSRALNPPAMYPKGPARLSDIKPGKLVNLRLSGHSVIEVVLEER